MVVAMPFFAIVRPAMLAAPTLLLALSWCAASAAAPFDHATPGPEAVVAAAPGQIDIYTKDPASPNPTDTQAIVVGPDGQAANAGEATVDPADHRHIEVTLFSGLSQGRYIVEFKTRGEFDLERDGGQYAFYLGVQPTAAQRRADKGLSLTTIGGEDVSISGYQRGLIEGVIPAFIIIPAGAYYLRRRKKGDQGGPAGMEAP
jgi:methionine-rich copper-binding protein CopC